jgi:hypothetical protein
MWGAGAAAAVMVFTSMDDGLEFCEEAMLRDSPTAEVCARLVDSID